MTAVDVETVRDITAQPTGLATRKFKDRAFVVWGIVATVIGLGTLVALVLGLMNDALVWPFAPFGESRVSSHFFLSFPSADPAEAGILSAWVGSLLVILTTALFAIPIGILAGIYLEEYAGGAGPITWNSKTRAPLLLIGGGIDLIAPASMTKAIFGKQKRAKSLTELKIYEDSSHYLCAEPGWEDVADYALSWAERNQRGGVASIGSRAA